MGRKLDLSGLTDDEAEHVLKVVQRDMKLRKKEEERLSEMKQELAEEGSRCSILSKQHRFNEHCCIRCCAPFTFLFNPKRQCLDCQYNVCKTCCTYNKRDRAWLCSACQKGRIFRTQSLEWYYDNVKSRFKRFGSAKVLKTLYRKHIIERGAFSDLPESSVHDGSNDNDGSICGSDSVFYRQSEGHSMAETLTVALRVAEEAIEEAIAKAEEFRDSLEKQNEARYLRDHKEELIEELATTIVQKIIQRRKKSEMQTEYDFVWPQPQSLIQTGELPSPSQPHTSSQEPIRNPYPLWRSRSAFSLTSEDSPEKGLEEEEEEEVAAAGGGEGLQEYASLKREGKAASLPGWKSMDRLDNTSTSSVLQSPDGNWIALHSSQLSRPSLLTKRKSLVFSVLEKESSVVSAYDEMGSDSEEEDEGGWGAALQQFHRKLSDETYYTDSQHDPEWTYTQHAPVTSPSSGLYTNTETLNSDSEASSVLSACPRKPTHDLLRKKGPADTHLHPHQQPVYHQHLQQSLSPYSAQTEALDVNFNPKVMGDSSEGDDRQCVQRSRRRRKSKKESSTEQNKPGGPNHSQAIYPLAQENSGFLLNALLKRGLSDEQPVPDYTLAVTAAPDALKLDAMTPEPEALDTVAQNCPSLNPAQPNSVAPGPEILSGSVGPESGSEDHLEEEIRSTLSRLASRENSKDSTSSDEEGARSPEDKVTDKESEKQRVKSRPKQTERQRQCASANREKESEAMEQVNGQLMKRAPGLAKSASVREETRVQERRLEKRAESFVEKVVEKEQKRGEVNRVNKKQCKRNGEKEAAQKGGARMSGSSASSPAVTPSSQEGGLSNNQQRYSAASLCSITTEVLKVLNATEDLIGEAGGESYTLSESMSASPVSSSSETRRLDQRLTKIEENVYLAAGAVYGLEGALGELEHCARSISSETTDTELAFLEDQVATAAAQVHQSELQISNIEARISALKTAGLNVTVCNRFSKIKPKSKPETLDSSRHQRRKLPAPPLKEKLESEQQVKALRP
ncbi:rab effector MyRIP isoform X1 [Girardinichthys multiradiatus]|uniref:rab effector MyRIP isoform X1 n=2 Tax=Girardinichthys multiradiatus TaxID=208333 RepID=UPI001FACFA05|nr:rab effector MyRIP isoform X1 [Girardinichthys multiradiatus]